MSFPAEAGILTPVEFQTIRTIYDGIASETWFTRSEERRQQFAAELLDAYHRGVTHPTELAIHAREIAALKFGNATALN